MSIQSDKLMIGNEGPVLLLNGVIQYQCTNIETKGLKHWTAMSEMQVP